MLCEDPFDSIDDLLEFQLFEKVDGFGGGGAMTTLHTPAITGGIHGLPDGGRIDLEDDELSMGKYIEIINPDWVSNYLEDSELNFLSPVEFRSQSPISVLETNIAYTSSSNPNSPTTQTMTRTRTKRPRAQVNRPISHWLTGPEISEEKKKEEAAIDTEVLKKCTHCESQKTPQWRAGPMGPKTLCNACGVRYKSGRLFPEYRPAMSPSFSPSLHSNSHRKVVEMRQQMANMSSLTKNCGLLDYIRNK